MDYMHILLKRVVELERLTNPGVSVALTQYSILQADCHSPFDGNINGYCR